MKVYLAGYNIDSAVIENLKKKSPLTNDITPETLSAAYARISRDQRSVDKLREIARVQVEKARRSNRNIIFKMGHHSVAEHAVFNFDIIGVSRLVIEEIEKFRLCSFTEKSQRYITLGNDFIIPDEVKRSGKQRLFMDTIKAQNDFYNKLYKKLKSYFFEEHKDLAKKPRKYHILDGWAKEDARYIVSLATLGQLGMTINARNLEYLIRRFASKRLSEIKELNQKMYDLAKEISPSIILFTDATDFDSKTYDEIKQKSLPYLDFSTEQKKEVELVAFTPDADSTLAASILHTSSFLPYRECIERVKKMKPKEKEEYMKEAFKHMEFYDSTLREFEYIDLTFNLIVSAACFAQLKRHRMATITVQDYDPELDVTVPPSIEKIGARKEFTEIIDKTNDAYSTLKENRGIGAEYVLTNSHRRRVLMKVNARELYHISRLREDPSAQWDIRTVVGKMTNLAKEAMPLTFLLIGGKNIYPKIYKEIFCRLPKFSLPEMQK